MLRTLLLIAMGATVVFVLSYAWLVLPLDLGVGLTGGYQALGDISLGLGTTTVWLGLTIFLTWFLGRRTARPGPRARSYWIAVLGVSIALPASYPLVVLFMYVALDSAMPSGQLAISVIAGRVYWFLLAASLAGFVASPIALRLLSRRHERAH